MGKKSIKRKIQPRSPLAHVMRWHFVLKLSPSYELAHRYRTGRTTKQEFFSQVAEPEAVLNTYDNFGYTWDQPFNEWEKQRGRILFAPQNASSQITTIAHLRNNENVDQQKFDFSLWSALNAREEQGKPPMLILSIPLDIPTAKALRGVKEKILMRKEVFKTTFEELREKNKPKYDIQVTKLRTSTINTSIRVVETKITHPDWPLWKVGVKFRLNEGATESIQKAEQEGERLKSQGKKLDKRNNAFELKVLMNTLTSRFIKYGYLLAENAARGRFPCIAPILNADGSKVAAKYDFMWMHEMLVANMKRLGQEIPD